jgi:hypothetical protein
LQTGIILTVAAHRRHDGIHLARDNRIIAVSDKSSAGTNGIAQKAQRAPAGFSGSGSTTAMAKSVSDYSDAEMAANHN